MIICSVCGSENMDGSVYCEDCGARLPAAAAGAPAPAVAPVATLPEPPAPTPIPQVEPTRPEVASPAPGPGGTIVCAACGAENPPDESYCEDCGASLSAGAPSVSLTPETPPVMDSSSGQPVAPAVRARLVLEDGNQEFILDKDVINIGRRSPVDGIFPEVDLTEADKDSYISRRHGKLTLQDSHAVYEDLGSSNGSFLNGNRLQSGVQTVVKDGDRLRLGKTEMVFRAS